MSDSYQTLALEIARLNKRLNAMSGPQLAYSSIEDGALQEFDLDGQLSSVIGQQYDGTHGAVSVAGPLPPTPSAPTITTDQGVIIVGWDGTWVQSIADRAARRETVAPLDFTRVEVHINGTPDYSALEFETMRGTIESSRGGQVVIPLPAGAVAYARLVARTAPGKVSVPSVVVGPASPGLISADDIDIDFSSLGGNHIFFGPTEPEAIAEGDLWLKTPENVVYGWSVGDDAWIIYRDQGVVQALLDAQAAAEAADAAQDAADAASALATLAKSTADGKVTVYRQSTAPSGGTYKVNGDLWIDSDDGLVYYPSTASGSWVATPDQRIATALTTANTATSTVATKTTVFIQTSAPSTTGRTVGDLWLDSDDGNKRYVWVSGAWTIATDAQITAAAALAASATTLANTAQTSADSKVTVYRQASAPTGGTYKVNGDLWIDSTGLISVATTVSGGWTTAADQRIATALTNANTANTTVATKTTVFAQISQPGTTGRTVGDLWIDTDDGNTVYDWPTGGPWTKRALGATALSVTARELGGITTYFQTSQPASGMIAGDLWIDTDDSNRTYRFGTTWVVSEDQRIGTALSTATSASTAVATKITTFAQTSPPSLTGRTTGDVWIDTDDGNKIYTWTGAWTIRTLSGGAVNLTIPYNKVPGDGQDYINFGTDLPPELDAYLDTAMVMYSGSYNAALTTIPQVKYFGFGMSLGSLSTFAFINNWNGVANAKKFLILQTFSFNHNNSDDVYAQFGAYDGTTTRVGYNMIAGGPVRHSIYPFPSWLNDTGAFRNGTKDYSTGDASATAIEKCAVHRSADGMVHLQGLAILSTLGINRGQARIIAVLGTAYTPAFPIVRWGMMNSEYPLRIDVYPNGNVQVQCLDQGAPASAYIALDMTWRGKDLG